MSHHPTSTKEAVVNIYHNHAVSTFPSGPTEKEYSKNIVDKLLTKNGFSKPGHMYNSPIEEESTETSHRDSSTLQRLYQQFHQVA